MNPQVSVCMKVLNGESLVARSIECIRNQSFENFEFIIVDDGSTDGTWAILENMAAEDDRIILLRNDKNEGLPRSGNRALEMASGQFLALQDADDWSYPQRLEKQVMFLEEHEDHVAVGSQMLVMNDVGLPIRLWKVPLHHEEIDHLHLNGFGGMLPHPAMMVRTAVLKEIGGYREEYPVADDYDLLLRLAEMGRICNLRDVLVRYTQHSGNITGSKLDRWAFYKQAVLRDAWKRRDLGDPGFSTLPNPAIKRSEGYRALSLLGYGLKNIFRNPRSLEGWNAAKGAALRLARKKKTRP